MYSLFYVGMITFHFLWGGGGEGGCLICPIVWVVKLLTGFEAFGPPVKDFALGVSLLILDGAAIVQILSGVGVSTVQWAVYKRCFYNDT